MMDPIQPKNCNSATEVTENTETFKGLSQHATLTQWVSLENDMPSRSSSVNSVFSVANSCFQVQPGKALLNSETKREYSASGSRLIPAAACLPPPVSNLRQSTSAPRGFSTGARTLTA